MPTFVLLMLVMLGVSGGKAAPPPDPTVTDGDKYTVVLENEHVRVLRYHDEPGEKTHMHTHPAFVLYAVGAFTRELTFPDGTKKQRTFKAGEVVWMQAQSHLGHNIGKTPTDVILVEVKSPH